MSLFCYALLFVHSSLAIILKRKRNLVALILLSYRFIVTIKVLWLFLTVPWVGLHYVSVVFPGHINLHFYIIGHVVLHYSLVWTNSCRSMSFIFLSVYQFSNLTLITCVFYRPI